MGIYLGFSLAYHPEIDGKIEVTNRILENILRSLVSEHPKQWDQALPQVKVVYNDSPNKITRLCWFYIVYVMHPRGMYEFRNLGKMEVRSKDVEDFSTTMQSLDE